MPQDTVYWIDANILITAKNGPFRFTINPKFWSALDAQAKAGRVRCPKMVYDEIVKDGQKDDLAKWVQVRRTSGIFVGAGEEVQRAFRSVADHVVNNHDGPQAAEFLNVADPWLIAHALASKGTVVTFEKPNSGKRPKIPSVCKALGVPFVDLYDMLEALGVQF